MGEFILYCSMLAVHLLYNQVLGKKKKHISISKMVYNLEKLLPVFIWIFFFFYKVMLSVNTDGAISLLSVLTWTH